MHIKAQEALFLGSFGTFGELPESQLPEFCFWGRSNVGKSSLINYLCNRKQMARVSRTPGKTQTFNLYKMDNSWLIMDVPGYGFANVSKKLKEKWAKEIGSYLRKRSNLCLVFLLVDASIDIQKIDLDTINYLGQLGIPFHIILTKADKTKDRLVTDFTRKLKEELLKDWNECPPIFITSSEKRFGSDDLFLVMDNILIQVQKETKNGGV